MKRSIRLLAAALTAASFVATAPAARAADLAAGSYSGTADLGSVHLDGTYPFVVGPSTPGTIDVAMLQTGALTARVSLFGMGEDAVGQITQTAKEIRLTLRGKTDAGRINVTAKLVGDAFVGKITLKKKTSTCRIPIKDAGPVAARYQLALTVSAKGAVAGSGTLFVGSAQLPVTVKGTSRKGVVALTIKGGKTLLTLAKGKVVGGAIVSAKWTARGFGALVTKATRRLTFSPPV